MARVQASNAFCTPITIKERFQMNKNRDQLVSQVKEYLAFMKKMALSVPL
jgi:predicted RNA-binding protein with PIN domain